MTHIRRWIANAMLALLLVMALICAYWGLRPPKLMDSFGCWRLPFTEHGLKARGRRVTVTVAWGTLQIATKPTDVSSDDNFYCQIAQPTLPWTWRMYRQVHCSGYSTQHWVGRFCLEIPNAGDWELGKQWSLTVPVWFVFVLVIVYPALRLRRWVRILRRRARGLCLTCGYDLRATPGRCPECGTPCTGK